MTALFESGRIVDLILALMIAEAVIISVVVLFWRVRLPLVGLLLNLAAGACLLLALRAVITDAGWWVAGAWLFAALLAHVGDLAQRLQRRAKVG